MNSAVCIFDPTSSFNSWKIKGSIHFKQNSVHDFVFVTISLSGFPKNSLFACHIHEYGDLSEGCASACSHFNPFKQLHGSLSLHHDKRHVGDLAIPNGNLNSDKNGNVQISFYDDLISLDTKHPANIIGRMVVIHEKADDGGKFRDLNTKLGQESGKTGNAGKRIACSVIGISPLFKCY